MSTRGKEYKQNRKYDKDGNLVPVSKVQKMYQNEPYQPLIKDYSGYINRSV